MKMTKILFGTILAAVVAGCVSVSKNTGDDANLKPWIVKDVVHEKYSVDQNMVSGFNQLNCLFGCICWGGNEVSSDQTDAGFFGAEAKAKNGAYARACDQAGCDQLVAARYTVTSKDYFVFKQVKAEVKGYPAKVTGVEVIENKMLAPAASKVSTGVGAFGF